MSDLVEQLELRARFAVAGNREYAVPFDSDLDLAAKARIEALEAENARLVEAEARAAKAAVHAVIALEAMNMAGKHRSMSKEMWAKIQNGIAAVRAMIAARAAIGGKDD